MCNKEVEYLRHSKERLALHSWIPSQVKSVVFYLHGMQSHAGWSFEIGEKLAAKGVALFILDRMGIGLSSGSKGDISSADDLLNDYYKVLNIVRQRYSNVPLTLFGQSFGGSILAALLSWDKFPMDYDAVAFCTSGLGKRHDELSDKEYAVQLKDRSEHLIPLNFSDSDMTDLSQFLHFIKKDPYPCKKITCRTRAVTLELENMYYNKVGIIKDKTAVFICPKEDPIVNTSSALKIFQQITNNKGLVLQLPAYKHYLWFTEQRYILTSWLINFALSGGYRKSL